MAIEVREVREDEFREAGRVTADAYREFGALDPNDPGHMEDYLRRLADVRARAERALVLGAFEDGGVLGTVTLELEDRIRGGHPRDPLHPGEAHVRMLAVAPEARRRGIGRRLMEACIEIARRAGKTELTLETTDGMAAARRLYESMGFRRGPDRVWDDGFRVATYSLAL